MAHRILEFIPGIASVGLQEFTVSDVSSAEIIDGCMVRFTMVASHAGLFVPQCCMVWTVPSWVASRVAFNAVREAVGADPQTSQPVRMLGSARSH